MIPRTCLLILTVWWLASCSKPPQVQVLSGHAQGTTWHVSVWKEGDVNIQRLQTSIQKEFERLDKTLSNYRPDSMIEGFNNNPTTAPVVVGAEIVGLVQRAREVGQASDHCYDLTMKPLFDLWGFSSEALTPPDDSSLKAQLQLVGVDKLLTISDSELQKKTPLLKIDLSSIAQGYSVSRIAEVVEQAGIQNYLVEIGGELQTRGYKPDGSYWRIGMERPLPGGRSVQKTLTIIQDKPVSVMTSGTYRHYFDVQGQRYSHVLDARTGRPVTHNTVSVTVINDDPTLADAWSTALLCLGSEDGVMAANRNGIAALFIAQQGAQLQEVATEAWRSMKAIEVD
jgi:thiamine biosynthesis lipoprotein